MSELNSQMDLVALMQRIRSVVEKRRSQHLGLTSAESSAPSPENTNNVEPAFTPANVSVARASSCRPAPAIELNLVDPDAFAYQESFQPTADGRYDVRTLLRYHDRQFIYAAYRAIMLRAPDQEGLNSYLRHLRAGMSKIEILQVLRDSSEGRAASVPVSGLSVRVAVLKMARWPIVGGLIRFGVALYNLPDIERKARLAEGNIFALVEHTQDGLKRSVSVANRALRDLEQGYIQLNQLTASKADQGALCDVHASIEALRSTLSELHDRANA